MNDNSTTHFPSPGELKNLGGRRKRLNIFYGLITKGLPLGDLSKKVMRAMSTATSVANGKKISSFSFVVETMDIDSCAICSSQIADGFIRDSEGDFSYDDFLGLSSRERGKEWDEVNKILEALVASGYKVTGFSTKSETHPMLDRAWVYPVTITIEPR